jgi:DNA polymerase III subunit epsilon
MDKILIIDTETTGLKPEDGAVLIEVGAILFDVELREVIAQLSFLLPVEENAAEHVNRISPELTTKGEALEYPMLTAFRAMAVEADYAVAHNAAFDSQWFFNEPLGLKWICTMDDVKWPKNTKRGRPSVMSLALDYGVPVWSAHRALTDCIYLAEVMKREPRLRSLLVEALEPQKVFVSKLPYERRQECKDAGFIWNQIVPRAWAKKMRPSEAEALTFPVAEIVV